MGKTHEPSKAAAAAVASKCKKAAIPLQKRANTTFPVASIKRHMRHGKFNVQCGNRTPVYAAGLVASITRRLIVAAAAQSDHGRPDARTGAYHILPFHLASAGLSSPELLPFLGEMGRRTLLQSRPTDSQILRDAKQPTKKKSKKEHAAAAAAAEPAIRA